MRKILLLLLSLNILNIYAKPTEETKEVYCLIKGSSWFKNNNNVHIKIDYGQERDFFWGIEDAKDESNKSLKFNSMIDAINYMSLFDWQFVNAIAISEGEYSVYNYLLKKTIPINDEVEDHLFSGKHTFNIINRRTDYKYKIDKATSEYNKWLKRNTNDTTSKHISLLEIPIDTTKNEFIKMLEQKGFTNIGDDVYSGYLSKKTLVKVNIIGQDSIIKSIAVELSPNRTSIALYNRYEYFYNLLCREYGEPIKKKSIKNIGDKTNIIEQKLQATFAIGTKGFISVYISGGGCVVISYNNFKNNE